MIVMSIDSFAKNNQETLKTLTNWQNDVDVKAMTVCDFARAGTDDIYLTSWLNVAAIEGNRELFSKLLEQQKFTDSKFLLRMKQCLIYADGNGHDALCNDILDKMTLNRELFMFALNSGRASILEKLYQRGLKIDEGVQPGDYSFKAFGTEKGYTLLCVVIELGKDEVVETLLKHGANPNQKTQQYEFVPLYMAITHNNAKIVDILLAQGANPN